MKKYFKYIFFCLLLLITFLAYKNKPISEEVVSKPIVKKEEEKVISKIYVDIKGQVKNPGVYEFDAGQRIIDAIKKSGGFLKNAETKAINLSKLLSDEMVIYVYKKEEEQIIVCPPIVVCPEVVCEEIKNDACTTTNDTLISINSASLEQLQELPGIGLEKAKDIIEYRTDEPFKKIEDIMKVSGIGEASFNKIKSFIKI